MPNKFLTASFLSFMLCAFFYFFFNDIVLSPQADIYKSQRQLLLEAYSKKDHKIIIDSGSNSLYAIEPSLIQSQMQRVTINASDMALVPLHHKINRLKTILKNNDVLIMPLEWSYYSPRKKDITGTYLNSISTRGHYTYYYYYLPLPERIAFIFGETPPDFFWKNFLDYFYPKKSGNASSIKNKLSAISQKMYAKEIATQGVTPPEVATSNSCDKVNLYKQLDDDFSITSLLEKDLKDLKDLSLSTQSKVILTWPAVVHSENSKCYTSSQAKKRLKNYSVKLRKIIQSYGLTIVGEYEDSVFPASCMRDSYYHIKHHCALTRTERLISELKKSGVNPDPNFTPTSSSDLIDTYLLTQAKNYSFKSPKRDAVILEKDIDNYGLTLQGWYTREKWGRWSKGNTSTLLITTPDELQAISFTGRYFGAADKTQVWVNNTLIGNYKLTNQRIPVNGLGNEKTAITIKLIHSKPTSPASLSDSSNDHRLIKFGLESISLH